MNNKYKGPFAALAAYAGWTRFYDMHSGGIKKERWDQIYIQAPEEEAKIIFTNRFKHDPENRTCDCCGDDYSISFNKTLDQHYDSSPSFTLVIPCEDIANHERVWQ
jgi:hypothetical protein